MENMNMSSENMSSIQTNTYGLPEEKKRRGRNGFYDTDEKKEKRRQEKNAYHREYYKNHKQKINTQNATTQKIARKNNKLLKELLETLNIDETLKNKDINEKLEIIKESITSKIIPDMK